VRVLDLALWMSEEVRGAADARAASLALNRRVLGHGAVSLQSRLYYRPNQLLTSAVHWAAGGFVVREAPAGWVGSPGYRYVCFDQNPLLRPVREGLTRYKFSDFAPYADRAYAPYWEAFAEGGIADGICAAAFGSERRMASVHVGVGERALDPAVQDALALAAAILAERLMEFRPDGAAPPPPPALGARERDAIAYVAEGKTDWEIAQILGIAESTARFHVDNARRKLGATNRAHAVAKFLAAYGAP
jgi:LuxR family quorum sensing-dependent transcriptional regulator